jgi:hypothetical protein
MFKLSPNDLLPFSTANITSYLLRLYEAEQEKFYFTEINIYFDLCLLKVRVTIYYKELTVSAFIKYSMLCHI